MAQDRSADTPSPTGQPPAKARPRRVELNAATRGLLARFLRDWLLPRWWQILGATLLTGALAAATGAYPMVIKHSFDTLLKGDASALPFVLAAVVVITAARSLFMFLQSVATQKIVLRMIADMQRTAFQHLLEADFERLTRDTPGRLMSKLTNDIGFIQVAVLASLNTVVRDFLSVVALVG